MTLAHIRTGIGRRILNIKPFFFLIMAMILEFLFAACSEGQTTGQTGSPKLAVPLPGQTIPRDELSTLGFKPQDMIDLAIGKHLSELKWVDGDSTGVELDVRDFDFSARYVESEPPCLFELCKRIEIEVQFTIRTDDGRLYSRSQEPGMLIADLPEKVHLYGDVYAFNYVEFPLPPELKGANTEIVVSAEFTASDVHGSVMVRPESEDKDAGAFSGELFGKW